MACIYRCKFGLSENQHQLLCFILKLLSNDPGMSRRLLKVEGDFVS